MLPELCHFSPRSQFTSLLVSDDLKHSDEVEHRMGYESGKIYKITSGDYFYYGSCITTIARRQITHRYRAKKKTSKLYNHIKTNDWTMELVCNFACKSKAELLAKEDEYVKPNISNPKCLNERSACWDKEKDSARKKVWYELNKERILAEKKQQWAEKRSKSAPLLISKVKL
jgi:hypothetical protein